MLMSLEFNTAKVSAFRDYLIEKNYSDYVIPMYVRGVSAFLEEIRESPENVHAIHLKLKGAIDRYAANIPLTFKNNMVKSALHTYYHFVSREKFTKRLSRDDYELNLSIEFEIERFREYLLNVERLRDSTITSRCNTVRIFLYSSFLDEDFSPNKINTNLVQNYLVNTLSHISASSKKSMIGRIRNYIKFLAFVDDIVADDILKLPMASPVWKYSSNPKYLTDCELEGLFSSYDRNKPYGARDYAIARCLGDLGLRCSEAAGLSLDDFNWDNGNVIIKQTKTYSERTLPLPVITGQAIEDYLLKWRPHTKVRTLFVRYKNQPGESMGVSQVRSTVRGAAIRAGLKNFTGTHSLRHTVAKEMINNGTSLKIIADILGHESIETTYIYTKLNFSQLKDVTATWPEVRK